MTKDCCTCIHEYRSPMSEVCRECGIAMLNYKERTLALTNADRIRAMTDEELARFVTREDLCELTCGSQIPCDGRCESMMLAWLKAPVEEEKMDKSE